MLDFRHFSSFGAGAIFALALVFSSVMPATASAGTDKQALASEIASMLLSQDATERAQGLNQLSRNGQDCMSCLLKITDNGTTDQRRGAVVALALLPIPELATDGLLKALGDKDATVRSLAAHALARIGSAAALPTARLLTAQDEQIRNGAGLALSKMGPKAIPALKIILKQGDAFARAKAAWLLGSMGEEAMPAVPALIRALTDNDMRVVHVVCETLDLIGPEPAMVFHELTLLGISGNHSPFNRVGAQAAPTLVRLLTRPGTPMGNIALYTLARMGNNAEPALRVALINGTEGQKVAAALLLTGIDPKLAETLPEELRRSLAGTMHIQ